MRIKIIAFNIVIMLIISLMNVTYAVSGSVDLRTSASEVKKGETFTVTLVATSEDGINGVDTKYTYDADKLELISGGVVDSTSWSNLGGNSDITVICNSNQSIRNAEIYSIKFKVKDSAPAGAVAKIETTGILLDTDSYVNSNVSISAKKVEITIKDNVEEKQVEENHVQDNNTSDSSSTKTKTNTNTRSTTSSVSRSSSSNQRLPKTGANVVGITIGILVMMILVFVFYRKCKKYKY